MRGFAGEGGWQGAFRRDWWSLRAVEGCMLAPWCDRHNHRGTLRGICADALACAALSACAAESVPWRGWGNGLAGGHEHESDPEQSAPVQQSDSRCDDR